MPEVEKYVKKMDNVYISYGLAKALYHYLTSSYIFFDTGNIRVKPSKNQFVMNLWHGVPFKSIGFLSKTVHKDLPRDLMNSFSKIIVPSKNMKEIYMDSFLLNNNQIFYAGQPRNDLLTIKKETLGLLGIDKKRYKKIIMWMTTYRISKDERLKHTSNTEWSSTNLPLLTDEKAVKQLNEELERLGILLIIKHHTTGKKAESTILDTENIRVLDENQILSKGLQLYEVLGNCDSLITDYSSVFIDYLLLNRPIGFIVDDIEDYNRNNGFNFSKPLEYMPGKHIKTLLELYRFLKIVVEEQDKYKIEREEKSNYFNEFQKENNRQYILEQMGIKI